jgi:predicted acyl esterase
MRKSHSGEARRPTRLRGAAGLLTLAGASAAVAVELSHRRALAQAPERDRLRAPLHGATVPARSADGTQLHAEVFGPSDAATFVLVPGWTEELQFFDLVTRGLLGRGFRVVVYDLRGQGSSGGGRGLDQTI